MAVSVRVDLGKSAGFRIGRLAIQPATREIVRDDGKREVVEPRVMQVLVALTRAEGGIVTRDQLTESCWDGRIVGEDAINRVISRLRRVADGIGADSFAIETVTKVGYRLARGGEAVGGAAAAAGTEGRSWPTRRAFLGASAVLAGGVAAILWLRRDAEVEGETDPLMAQAVAALRQDTVEANNQAIGLLRQVVVRYPGDADGWGALAMAYAYAFAGRGAPNDPGMELRARAAAARAMETDRYNPYAVNALVVLRPQLGTWLERERILRAALAEHPANDFLLRQLGWLMVQVGRWREGAVLIARAAALAPSSPALLYTHVWSLWGAGRIEEADQALDRGLALFPTYYSLWFARFYILLYTGRAREALHWAEDRDRRPTGIPESEFETIILVARAMTTRRPDEIERALAVSFEAAHHASGHAENAIQFACGFGRIDRAFEIADALYFGRGFDPGELRFSREQRQYTRRSDHRTYVLFLPSTAPMRPDARFEPFVQKLGLDRYWAATRSVPDYRT